MITEALSQPKTWGICCPGPSLDLYESRKMIQKDSPECLVAVNGAILADYAFQYWAVQDLEVFAEVVSRLAPIAPMSRINNIMATNYEDLLLWIPERWTSDIPHCYPKLNDIFQRFAKETFPSNRIDELGQTMPFGKHLNWREFTLLPAIALAVKKGAQVIYVYGADWSGKGYFTKGLENERTIHNEKRWERERHLFAQIAEECTKNGITIIKEGILCLK